MRRQFGQFKAWAIKKGYDKVYVETKNNKADDYTYIGWKKVI